jgi:hypothetical protein
MIFSPKFISEAKATKKVKCKENKIEQKKTHSHKCQISFKKAIF